MTVRFAGGIRPLGLFEMLRFIGEVSQQPKRQSDWLRTRIDQAASQAPTVPA